MSYQFSFEKLIAWQKARELTLQIYKLTHDFPAEEKYNLVSQMRRSSISIASNIAEGSVRSTQKDKSRFLTMSYGSLLELYNQVLIASDLEYINLKDFEKLKSATHELSRILLGLKKSLK